MNEIELKHRMIVAEALELGMVGGVVASVQSKLKGIANAIGTWAREKVRPEAKIPLVTYNDLVKGLVNAKYSDLATVKITVPRGLKGPLNEYTESLFDVLVLVENVEEQVLKPFNLWLSLRIAAPDTLATAATATDLKNFRELDVDLARQKLSKFVDPLGRMDRLQMQEVYGNVGVIKTTWDNANALATRYLETNPTRIVKLVKEIAEKVDRLITIMESGKDEGGNKISAQTATILSGICLNMSQSIDLYGQMGILVRELVVACDHQTKELKKPLSEVKMVKESLAEEQVLIVRDVRVPFSFIANQLRWQLEEEIGIRELTWIYDYVPFDPLMDGEVRDSMSGTSVGCVRIGERFYPLFNTDLLAAYHAGGHHSVPIVYLTLDKLIGLYQQG